ILSYLHLPFQSTFVLYLHRSIQSFTEHTNYRNTFSSALRSSSIYVLPLRTTAPKGGQSPPLPADGRFLSAPGASAPLRRSVPSGAALPRSDVLLSALPQTFRGGRKTRHFSPRIPESAQCGSSGCEEKNVEFFCHRGM